MNFVYHSVLSGLRSNARFGRGGSFEGHEEIRGEGFRGMRESGVAQDDRQERGEIRFEKLVRGRSGVPRAGRRLRHRFRQSGAGHGPGSGERAGRPSQGGRGQRADRHPSAAAVVQGVRPGGGQEQRARQAVRGQHRAHGGRHGVPAGRRRPARRARVGRRFGAAVFADRAARRQGPGHPAAVRGRRVHRTAERRAQGAVPGQGRPADRVGAARVPGGVARPVRRGGRPADGHRQRADRAQRRSGRAAPGDRRPFRVAGRDARDRGRSSARERVVRRPRRAVRQGAQSRDRQQRGGAGGGRPVRRPRLQGRTADRPTLRRRRPGVGLLCGSRGVRVRPVR